MHIQVGNTPLVEVDGVFAKLECTNPCGSIKDRIAEFIINESEKSGLLKPGMIIVEATSGNTGIAFSYFAKEKGYKIKIIMPKNMTRERQQIITDLGAELILCSAGNFAEAAAIRDEIAQDPKYFNPDQFSNPLNTQCHYQTTGQEILKQMSALGYNSIDGFVAGIGTGGTLIGVGQALKEVYPEIIIAAVEPAESAIMSGGAPGEHGIPGIGDGFIPAIASNGNTGLHELINEVFAIPSADAKAAAQNLRVKHGFCVGISSGANYLAAKQLSGGGIETVVTIFPDGYSNYKSQGLVSAEERCPHQGHPSVLPIKSTC